MATTKKVLVLNHRDGSRKSKVHAMFDAKGPEEAKKYGLRLKLKGTTLNSWFAQFRKCVATKTPRKVRAKVKVAEAA